MRFLFRKKHLKYIIICLLVLGYLNISKRTNTIKSLDESNLTNYSSSTTHIFISGFTRSGITLMRAILDVHPLIKCGPETKILPDIIDFIAKWVKQGRHYKDKQLKVTGIDFEMIDIATRNFLLEILSKRKLNSPILCAKDPQFIENIAYIHQILPNAKLIYMIRDGRAVAHSNIVQSKDKMNSVVFKEYLVKWKNLNEKAIRDCDKMGADNCIRIKYEDLVLHPEKTLRNLASFLDVPWTKEFLNHLNHIGNDIKISRTEWSSHQIVKPNYTESLYPWIGKYDINPNEIRFIEPLLNRLNYEFDININFKADSIVIEKLQTNKRKQRLLE